MNKKEGRKNKKQFEWDCTKCSKIIKGNSENTLTINKGLHLKWHEIND